ncbi:MAG: flagellar biosynthetic protein FliQ [Epsilonproteobacteria bacterium]|nr:MAG: flagellar biosynthetic protein FliQ [Campylobacterota bacterium]RLA66692.1 MAG: flagellar biosynthetic protein FliQ [Campylobacterota bacterium]
MGSEFASDIAQQGIKVALMIASPMLIGALLVGILVSIFQAVTQINEQTLSFIPKILVIVGALMIFSPWMSDTLTNYTKEVFLTIPKVGGR